MKKCKKCGHEDSHSIEAARFDEGGLSDLTKTMTGKCQVKDCDCFLSYDEMDEFNQ